MTGPASVINLVIGCHFYGERENNRLLKVEREGTKFGTEDKLLPQLFCVDSMSAMSDVTSFL